MGPGGKFLWVPGVPKALSETGNCNSAAPRPSPQPPSSSPSRNSRPWTLAPQLIHSPGAGPPPQAGTDIRTRAPARPKSGWSSRQAGEYRPRAPSPPVRRLLPLPRRTDEPRASVPRSRLALAPRSHRSVPPWFCLPRLHSQDR
ncbi:hypothetical protein NN561_006648 [Cricetulus griseus]